MFISLHYMMNHCLAIRRNSKQNAESMELGFVTIIIIIPFYRGLFHSYSK